MAESVVRVPLLLPDPLGDDERPYHVNQANNAKWGWTEAPVNPAMKMLPEKLQEAGYAADYYPRTRFTLTPLSPRAPPCEAVGMVARQQHTCVG